jgi:diguanylate cyclase (GGDEF)-like protein
VGDGLVKIQEMPQIARWLIHQHSFKYYDSQTIDEIAEFIERDHKKASVFMGMPIVAKGKSTLGVMGIYSDERTSYSTMQQNWLKTIGEYLGIMIQGIIRDQRIKGMNLLDQLTALPNRNQFYQQLEEVIREVLQDDKKSLSIYHIDLGGFKNINSTYGHIIGDQFLKAIADKLYDFQKDNMLISRLGGDEFLAYYAEENDNIVYEKIAQSLIDLVREPITIDEVNLSVTSNIGISIFNEKIGTIDELLQEAYEALLMAKKMGPDTYYLDNNH